MRYAVLVALAACGRIHFRAVGGGDDGGDDGDGQVDAPPSTGAVGARYLIALDANAVPPPVAGSNGRVAVAENFQGATTIAGRAFTGLAMYQSGALLWFDPAGVPAVSSVVDSTSICSVRRLGNTAANDGVLTVGYSQAGTTTPADGPCAIATSRQDAIAINVDPTGVQTLAGHFTSKSMNSQGWYAAGFADGSVALSGIYGDNGNIGSTMLPAAGSDENPYFARIDPATGEARWIASVFSTDDIFAGPIDPQGDDLCITGAIVNTATVLGTQLTSIGLVDDFVARVDGTGNPRFVRAFGSTGNDSTTEGLSVAATSDGGCTVAAQVPADLTIDGLSLPVSGGGAVLLRFDATGTAVAGARAPTGLIIGRLGDRIYGAGPCGGICTIAGAPYTAVGTDIVFAAFDANAHGTVIGALTGGAATLDRFSPIPPDALAVTFAVGTSAVAFGGVALNAPGSSALAVLGVAP